jgi:Sec-independent protein translocase protein TatA
LFRLAVFLARGDARVKELLPEIGTGMGKAIKNFKGATAEIEHKDTESIAVKETS